MSQALQADGWYLRSEIVWHKPNPMPESVRDRPTKAHEMVYLLTKSAKYFWDQEAVREPVTGNSHTRGSGVNPKAAKWPAGWSQEEGGHSGIPSGRYRPRQDESYSAAVTDVVTQRNIRSVWTIPTAPFPEAHFATFPPALVEPMVKAGSRGPGKRCDCNEIIQTPIGSGGSDDPSLFTGRAGMNRKRKPVEGVRPITRREQREYAGQLRDSPHLDEMKAEAGDAFAHYIRTDSSGARPLPPDLLARWHAKGWLQQPSLCSCPAHPASTILDPFAGAGTALMVALRLGRQAIGIELNPEYAEMARARILADAPLLNAEVPDGR